MIRLQAEEHGPGILDSPLDGLEEGDRLAAVHQAVVVRQRDEHHGTDHDLNNSLLIEMPKKSGPVFCICSA